MPRLRAEPVQRRLSELWRQFRGATDSACRTAREIPRIDETRIRFLARVQYRLYILRCSDDSLYTGIATDVPRRLAEHRAGIRGAKYLRGRLPIEIVFECEAGSRSEAQRLEHRIKRLSRERKEALIAGEFCLEADCQASGVAAG